MELDIKKTITAIVSKLWIIIAVSIVSAVLFFLYNTFFVTKMYTSQALLYVSNMSERKTNVVTSSDVTVSRELLDTCVVILNSRTVLDKVEAKIAEESDLKYTASQIKGMITAQSVSSTEVFRISITNPNPLHAQIIADAIITIAPSEIKRVLNAGAVSIIDYATRPVAPSSPNVPMQTMFGGVIGAILSVFVVVVNQVFDNRVKDEFTLLENFELPIIGIIPSFKMANKGTSAQKTSKKEVQKK